MDFYDRVKDLVKQHNFSLIPFLNSLGINYETYKSAKRYNNLPRVDEAAKIANALNVSTEYLLYGDENISDLEAVLIVKFRKLSEEQKKLILSLVDNLANK